MLRAFAAESGLFNPGHRHYLQLLLHIQTDAQQFLVQKRTHGITFTLQSKVIKSIRTNRRINEKYFKNLTTDFLSKVTITSKTVLTMLEIYHAAGSFFLQLYQYFKNTHFSPKLVFPYFSQKIPHFVSVTAFHNQSSLKRYGGRAQ